MEWKHHIYRVGSHTSEWDDIPSAKQELREFTASARQRIEPWLSAVFQAEHLNLLAGSGLTTAVSEIAGSKAVGMDAVTIGSEFDKQIDAHAADSARKMGRGAPNIEDQFRSALAVLGGLSITDPETGKRLREKLNEKLQEFLESILATERGIIDSKSELKSAAEAAIQSFLLSFASRTASRDRLHIFTTNNDRLIEYGCDLAGIRMIDRFVGGMTPIFRSSRVEVDFHYNPPGMRGEPSYMEGVLRFSKLHGSIDWVFKETNRQIQRAGIPFGARKSHSEIPKQPVDTVLIYPNPAKDVETTNFPYADLFRDFAAALCRRNSVVVTYGYGFGDDHINRILLDMLTIPSTHLVIVSHGQRDRIRSFCEKAKESQVSLLVGSHFADLPNLIQHYLPKPALDHITKRMTDLLNARHVPGVEPNGTKGSRAGAAVAGKDQRSPAANRSDNATGAGGVDPF
jgi:hypothetical protein